MAGSTKLFETLRRMLGRGLKQSEVDAVNAALDSAVVPDAPSTPEAPGAPGHMGEAGLALVKQFDGMADIMKRMAGMGMRDRLKQVQELQRGGMMDPGAMLAKKKVGTGKRLTSEERNKLKKQREKEARKRMRDQKNKKRGG